MNQITIITASLSITGLYTEYATSTGKNTLTLDPYAACQALQTAGMIEGFEMDANNEPVILYSDPMSALGYGHEHWCNFVKSFPFITRYAEMLLEAREEKESFDRFYDILDKLMTPFAA